MSEAQPADPNQNQLFRWAEDLPEVMWQDLIARLPALAAEYTGAAWDGRAFAISLLGRIHRVEPDARRVILADDPERRLSYQTGLVLLHTLARSLGVPPAGRMVTPQELPGGSLFFQGPHAVNTRSLRQRFGGYPHGLLEAARPLGGRPHVGGDAGVILDGLPMVSLYVLIWGGDEEFKPRAVVGVDAHAHHHLALDGLWALTNLMIHRLTSS